MMIFRTSESRVLKSLTFSPVLSSISLSSSGIGSQEIRDPLGLEIDHYFQYNDILYLDEYLYDL